MTSDSTTTRAPAAATDEPQFLGLHHVLIGVPADKKEEAHHFYEDVVGFVPLASPLESSPSGNMWWYECGDAEFHVALVADYQPHRRPHLAIRVRNLPALRARLAKHGIQTDYNFSYRGSWRIYIVDPWENRLEFISQLPSGVRPGMTESEIADALAKVTDLTRAC